MACTTTDLLAEYLDKSEDGAGVVAVIREKWPKSITVYVSHVRKAWMARGRHDAGYDSAFSALLNRVAALKAAATTKKEKAVFAAATKKLQEFHGMSLQAQCCIQRQLKSQAFTESSQVDAMLSTLRLLPPFMDQVRVSDQERLSAAAKARTALLQKSSAAFTIQASQLLQRVRATLGNASANAFDLAFALGIATGRRMVEIFKTAELMPPRHSPKNEYAACFRGQVKKGAADKSEDYDIPLLAPRPLVLSALTRLRICKPASHMTNSEVNKRWSTSCNEATRRVLGEKRRFHDTRMIYGSLSFNAALPHSHSLNAWLKAVLGHANLNNSLNYSAVHIAALEQQDCHPFTQLQQQH